MTELPINIGYKFVPTFVLFFRYWLVGVQKTIEEGWAMERGSLLIPAFLYKYKSSLCDFLCVDVDR